MKTRLLLVALLTLIGWQAYQLHIYRTAFRQTSDIMLWQAQDANQVFRSYNRCVKEVRSRAPMWGSEGRDVLCHAGECIVMSDIKMLSLPKSD